MSDRPYVTHLFADPTLIGFQIDGVLYHPRDVNILFHDEPQRANPETCLHNVVRQVFSLIDGQPWGQSFVICVSCDSTITYEAGLAKNYEYYIDDDIWIHQPRR